MKKAIVVFACLWVVGTLMEIFESPAKPKTIQLEQDEKPMPDIEFENHWEPNLEYAPVGGNNEDYSDYTVRVEP